MRLFSPDKKKPVELKKAVKELVEEEVDDELLEDSEAVRKVAEKYCKTNKLILASFRDEEFTNVDDQIIAFSFTAYKFDDDLRIFLQCKLIISSRGKVYTRGEGLDGESE
jgi:hypothetical protein